MRVEQTREVLDHVAQFHSRAGDLYQALMEKALGERARMLLHYLARHERNLARSVAACRDASSPQVLGNYFRFTHDDDIFKPLAAVDSMADLSFDDVVDLAMDLDQKLLELYREMAQRARAPEVKDMFNSLLLQEMEEKQKLMQGALGMLDL